MNPLAKLPKADDRADQRRKRRALTEDELGRLLVVARTRPLAEYGRESVRKEKPEDKRKRSGWTYVPLSLKNLDAATARRFRCGAIWPPVWLRGWGRSDDVLLGTWAGLRGILACR